jgi:Putative zinc-finger
MKCDDCLNLLEEYIDGEAAARDAEQVNFHVSTCANCANEMEALTAEREIYARYDRELEISPSMWNAIAARTVAESRAVDSRERFSFGEWFAGLFAMPRYGFAGAVAVVIVAIAIGIVYLKTRTTQQPSHPNIVAENKTVQPKEPTMDRGLVNPPPKIEQPEQEGGGPAPMKASLKLKPPASTAPRANQSDVLYTDVAYTDIEDKDTASHLDQAQNLLLSFRTIKYSDDDEQVDVSYERAESRRLLNENIVLRRDAEMAGKFPAKSVLGSLEPFLIDIANLPEKASPNDVRQIKDRMQKTEIVAELRSY